MAGPNDKPAHCVDCGSSGHTHPYSNGSGGYTWLCGSCRYKREHPEAAPIQKFRKPRQPQKETLLDAIREIEAEPAA